MPTTLDYQGQAIALGDTIRILDITPDPDLDEDDLDLFLDIVGAQCEVERIDADGTAWAAVWWNGGDGTLLTLVGLAPHQMARVSG